MEEPCLPCKFDTARIRAGVLFEMSDYSLKVCLRGDILGILYIFEILVVRFDTVEMWFPLFQTSEHTRSLDCAAQK